MLIVLAKGENSRKLSEVQSSASLRRLIFLLCRIAMGAARAGTLATSLPPHRARKQETWISTSLQNPLTSVLCSTVFDFHKCQFPRIQMKHSPGLNSMISIESPLKEIFKSNNKPEQCLGNDAAFVGVIYLITSMVNLLLQG